MATLTIPKNELKTIVKESLREILEQETMKIRSLLLPAVSLKEQKDIEKRCGVPSKKVAKSLMKNSLIYDF